VAGARTPPSILLTGFEPFGGEGLNPSALVAHALSGQRIGGWPLTSLVLPCVFGDAISALEQALASQRPALVVCLGQAGGREGVTVERIAVNRDDARIPDNAGTQPLDRAVMPGAPAAYFSRLPVKALVAALQADGIPAAESLSAGSFVCNHLFYGLMHALRRRRSVQAGFVHLPWLPEQVAGHPGAFALPLDTQVQAVRHLLATALQWRGRNDLQRVGGALD
jgi:pyroglutamyl-peptidase